MKHGFFVARHFAFEGAEFFEICLGGRLKYSCCLYPEADTTLDQAEAAALEETCAHAALMDGQTVLELGCGWGSLSLWMAERYPNSSITAVSNSHGQRGHIEAQAKARGMGDPPLRYDGDDGEESCEECQEYKGQTHRRTWWDKRGLLARNGNPNFGCRRFDNCHHSYFHARTGEKVID